MAFERQLHDTKENNRLDIGRIMNSTKGDVAAANQQVELLRASLEGVIGQLEADLEHAHTEFKEAKKRHELMLEEASSSRDTALREAAEAREAALQEHYRFHERTLEDTKAAHEQTLAGIKANHDRTLKNAIDDHSRALANAIDDHERALGNSVEDKKMTENYLNGRLTLADEKVMHYQDRLQHLEDKLEITKSAAQAVAEAARTARETTLPVPASRGSMPMASGSNLPEKISPQALRESIIVLQEQLHERESQIEKLEQEFEMVDKDAPSKLKARDEEITWLRELLGVRLDDLQDIITTLSTPSYDRNEVRDAAIRLRANVQMEQQERERIMAGGGKFPSLASITNNITASPRNLPLAAAAAWGNWRKGQGSIGSLAEMAAPIRGDRSASQTPSKSSPQSFLSGLLTPPSTNMRQTPKTGPSTSTRQPQHRPLGGYSTPKRQISSAQEHHRRPLTDILPPETPALFRSASYDQDAEAGHYSLDPYVNNGEDVNEGSSLDGSFNTESQDERENPRALGPSIELAG